MDRTAEALPEKSTTPAIRREASRLFGDRAAGVMSADDEAELTAWLAADSRHAQAFAMVERMWTAIDSQTMPSRASVPVAASAKAVRTWRRRWQWTRREDAPRRGWTQGAVAASLAVIALWHFGDIGMRIRADVRTGVGEQQKIALSDGSVVLLNTGSAIALDYGRERRVRLLRGEAAFTVAAVRARPFIVETTEGTVTALGTRFLVRLEAEEARVAVTEHSVRVSPLDAAWKVVREGEALGFGRGRIGEPEAVGISDADAWTRGVIRVVNRPLADVVREIGRYHRGYVGIVGSSLARRPVNGVFHVDSPVRSIDAIEKSLGIRSTRIGDAAILLHD